MLRKIKAEIEYCGLNIKYEKIKMIVISIFGVSFSICSYLFLKDIGTTIFVFVTFLFLIFLMFSSYASRKAKIDEERENEFVVAISYFEIFIYNKSNVYQAFNKVIPYCNEWMKTSISNLLKDIDLDKTIKPFIDFAHLFKNNIAVNIMMSIYTMVDQGESYEQINNFQLLFTQFFKANQRSKIETEKRNISVLPSMPLFGAGAITIMLTMSIISIIGDLLNVI